MGEKAGMSTATVIQIVFIILKLVGVIHWSWWWVLSPMWISLLLALIIIGLVVVALKVQE
jgi:hypothetical protein